MPKINMQGIKDNAQHLVGIVVGLVILKPLNLRFNKDDRNAHWFSTISANIAASDVVAIELLPYKMIY